MSEHSSSTETSAPHSPTNVREALKLNDLNLIRAVSRMVEKQYDETTQHTAALDAKGGQLLGFIGATIALTLGVGSGFLRETVLGEQLAYPPPKPYAIIVWCVWIMSLALAVWAMWNSYRAVKVRPFKTLASRDILNSAAMRGHGDKEDERVYLRYVTTHMNKVRSCNVQGNEDKIGYLKKAQKMFTLAVLGLFLVVLMITPILLRNLVVQKPLVESGGPAMSFPEDERDEQEPAETPEPGDGEDIEVGQPPLDIQSTAPSDSSSLKDVHETGPSLDQPLPECS